MRPTREHTPLTDDLIASIVDKRHDARTADERAVKARRRPRQTRAMFLAHVEERCNRKRCNLKGRAR